MIIVNSAGTLFSTPVVYIMDLLQLTKSKICAKVDLEEIPEKGSITLIKTAEDLCRAV